jgi:Disulphide bond corrector protein DsbC.
LLKRQLTISILLLFFCCACTRPNKESNLPTTAATPASGHPRNSVDVVKAIASPAELRLNGSADAVVRVTVQNGYHINANPSTFSYLIATELTMNPAAGISVSFIVYPDAITKSFSFADKPLAVYQGTTDIKVRLKADKSSPVGTQNLSAKLRVQACDDQVCYAPGTLDVTIPVSIK